MAQEPVAFPLKRTSLADEICDYLRSAIYQFRIRPGDQVNELELMKQMGVSRSPIREAMRILEGEGIIERVSGKGAVVAKVTRKEIEENYGIRAVLEAYAAEQAVKNLTENDLSHLEEIYNEMVKAGEANDVKTYAQLNFDFHRAFVKLSKNTSLQKLLRTLHGRARWFLFGGLSVDRATEVSLKEHREILDAFVARDSERVFQAVRRHILAAGNKVQESFQEK
ncbi:MAG: GntR family transcriptional regulator [Terriglobales bacterium]